MPEDYDPVRRNHFELKVQDIDLTLAVQWVKFLGHDNFEIFVLDFVDQKLADQVWEWFESGAEKDMEISIFDHLGCLLRTHRTSGAKLTAAPMPAQLTYTDIEALEIVLRGECKGWRRA